MRKYLKKT